LGGKDYSLTFTMEIFFMSKRMRRKRGIRVCVRVLISDENSYALMCVYDR